MPHPNSVSSDVSSVTKPKYFRSFIRKQAPYVVLLVLALIGVAYTDIDAIHSLFYWQALVPVFGVICILARWRYAEPGPKGRAHLIWTQVLHWGVLLLVIRLLFMHGMQRMLDSDITGLVLLYLLALSTFLAGIYLDWRLCVVGAFLGIGAIAIAFLDEAALPMAMLAIAIVIVAFLWNRYGAKIMPSRAHG